MNVLNPKVALFFLALLPQFLTTNGWSAPYQFAVLGTLFAVQAFAIFCAVAYLAGSLNKYMQRPAVWHWAKWLKVVLFLILGVALVLSTN